MAEFVDVWAACRPWRPRGVAGFVFPEPLPFRAGLAGGIVQPEGAAPAPGGGPGGGAGRGGAPGGAPGGGGGGVFPVGPLVVYPRRGRTRVVEFSNQFETFMVGTGSPVSRVVSGLLGPAVVRGIRYTGGGFLDLLKMRLEFLGGDGETLEGYATFPDISSPGVGFDGVLGVHPDFAAVVYDVWIPVQSLNWSIRWTVEDVGPTPPSGSVGTIVVYEEVYA